jgi:predicted N-acyltransferase
MKPEIDVKVFKSISKLSPEEINSVSSDAFFTYEWFKTLESSKSSNICPVYFVAYAQDKVLAIAPCFIDKLDQFFYYSGRLPLVLPLFRKMLIYGHKIGFCQEHVLICFSPFAGRTKVCFSENVDKDSILSSLMEKMAEFCKKERILFSSFLSVSEQDKTLIKNLANFMYVKAPGLYPTFYLDVKWANFEEYVNGLKYKVRKNVRREIRKCAENNVKITEAKIDDYAEQLSSLHSILISKYVKAAKNPFGSSFFKSLSRNANGKTKLFIARKDGQVVGFCLLFTHGFISDVWIAGFNYELQKNTDFAYFNLAYYTPIQWAIKEGIKKIYYRSTAEKIKLDRGCLTEKSYCFVKFHDQVLGPLFDFGLNTPPYSYLRDRYISRSARQRAS